MARVLKTHDIYKNFELGGAKVTQSTFADRLHQKTGISSEAARDIMAMGTSVSATSRAFTNGKIKEISHAVTKGMTNGEETKTLTNFIGVSKLGYSLLLNQGASISMNSALEKAKSDFEKRGTSHIFDEKGLNNLTTILQKEKIIAPESKIYINRNNVSKSLSSLDKKLDTYSRRNLLDKNGNGIELSKLSYKDLVSRCNKARTAGNEELANILEAKIGILTVHDKKMPGGGKRVKVGHQISRMASININDPAMQGQRQIKQYYAVTKTLVKASYIYYKGIARGTIKVGNFALVGSSNLMQGASNLFYKAGYSGAGTSLRSASSAVMSVRNSIATAGNTVAKPIQEINRFRVRNINHLKNAKQQIPDLAIRGVRVVGRETGRAVIKGATTTGRAIQKTKTYQMSANSKTGKVIGKISKKIWSGARAVGRMGGTAGKGLSIVGNVISSPFKVLLKGLNFGNLILKKILLIIGGAAGGILVASVSFFLVITSLMMILNAISDSIEDFKTKTTMGATYAKLLEKEEEFNEAVMGLADTVSVPSGYSDYGISKYTNVNVHYLGADGKEMSWSGAVGDVDISVSEVTDAIWTYMKKKGWNNIAIAGLLGNIQRESNFKLTATEHGFDNGSSTVLNSGYGLCQWTNTQGNPNGRRYGLFRYAASKGKSPSDIDAQLGYLLYGEGSDSRIAREYGIKDHASVASATEEFCNKWERPAAATSGLSEVRIPAAQKFYEHYTNDPNFSDIESEAPEDMEDTSGDDEIIASGYSSTNTATIKGILSMAAIYIDQDFKKYGAFSDGVFADSVYKDYCAKLYDASHIVGINQTAPVVYYCPSFSAQQPEPEYHAASGSCNNKRPGGTSEGNWLNSGEGAGRGYTLSITKETDTYEWDTSHTDPTTGEIIDSTESQDYTKYTILETGPHGSISSSSSGSEDDIRSGMAARGCKNYKVFVTYRDHDSRTIEVACYCDECKGHIDAEAYVFVANVYDPSSEVHSSDEEDEEGTDTNQPENETKKDDAFNYVDGKDKEYPYSLYAIDKYATAFDNPTSEERMVYCINPNCSHYPGYASGSGPATMVSITKEDPHCPECETELKYPERGRPGDQESCDIADTKENKSAEKYIMENLTGLPIAVVDWWKNEGWYNELSTTKTYFRLPDFSESFDALPEPVADENGDRNVVNKENSTPYWFNAFTSKSGRNIKFEKTGWNKDNITRVRMLMASDWEELYGIKDFGYVNGAPMTQAQIAQMISSNASWNDLCDDRKNIMAQAVLFQQKASLYNTKYVLGGAHSTIISEIKRTDSFDCSGYVSCILYNAGLFSPANTSTVGLNNSPYLRRLTSDETLLPGDILMRYRGADGANGGGNHVVLYMGGDRISQARGKRYLLKDTFNTPSATNLLMSDYFAMRLTTIDEDKYTENNEDGSPDANNH